jgi:hypothetical protein
MFSSAFYTWSVPFPPKSTQLLHSTWSAPIYLSDDIDNQRGDLRGAQKEKK